MKEEVEKNLRGHGVVIGRLRHLAMSPKVETLPIHEPKVSHIYSMVYIPTVLFGSWKRDYQ